MTSEQYAFAIARIKELQNPALQPLGLALAWELNDLMTQAAQYEEDHDRECQEAYEQEEEKRKKQEANDQISMGMGYL